MYSLQSFSILVILLDAMDAKTTSEEATDSDDPVPSAPPPLYPVLPSGPGTTNGPAPTQEAMEDENTPTNTPAASPLIHRSQSDFNMKRVSP